MPCFKPLSGFRSRRVNPKTGKRPIVFNRQDGFPDMPVEFACGQCRWCRIDRSRQWAVRCVHEASLHDSNCFITLTYSDEFLPSDGSLQLIHFQLFMKRLRKRFGSGIRFFHCGEYGERFARPHYHACLFNFDFPDRVLWKERAGVRLYSSASLAELWPFGFSTIGDVSFNSAAYVARYIMKKVTGDLAPGFYDGRKPEYVTMSRRPGVGAGWFDSFAKDVFPSDEVVLKGKVLTVPKFYSRLFEVRCPSDFDRIKRKRKARALLRADDNTPERLAVKESILESKVVQLKRGFEYA